MQLTRLDRWLRERFVHEVHVYTLRAPEEIPAGVRAEELPDIPGRQYRFRYVIRRSKTADDFIAALKDNNHMFTTRIVDRTGWLIPLIAPDRKSLTWRLVWTVLTVAIVSGVVFCVRILWSNPEFQKNFWESIKTLKG